MGVYYRILNVTKREFIDASAFKENMKIGGLLGTDAKLKHALAILMVSRWRGDFVKIESDSGGYCAFPNYETPEDDASWKELSAADVDHEANNIGWGEGDMPSKPRFKVGDIVLYRLSSADLNRIADWNVANPYPNPADQIFNLALGDIYPMVITQLNYDATVGGRVFLSGRYNPLWIKSAHEGAGVGEFRALAE